MNICMQVSVSKYVFNPPRYIYLWMDVRWHGNSMFTFSRNFQTVFKSDSYAFQFGLAYLTQTDSISIHCGLTHQQGHLADRMQMTKTSSLFSGSPLPGERPHSLVEMSEKSFLPPGICLKEGRRKVFVAQYTRWGQDAQMTPILYNNTTSIQGTFNNVVFVVFIALTVAFYTFRWGLRWTH